MPRSLFSFSPSLLGTASQSAFCLPTRRNPSSPHNVLFSSIPFSFLLLLQQSVSHFVFSGARRRLCVWLYLAGRVFLAAAAHTLGNHPGESNSVSMRGHPHSLTRSHKNNISSSRLVPRAEIWPLRALPTHNS